MKHPEVRLVNYSIMIRKLLLQYIVRTKKQNLQVKWVLYKKLAQLFASEKDLLQLMPLKNQESDVCIKRFIEYINFCIN